MLLLVMQAKHDRRAESVQQFFIGPVEQRPHPVVDRRAEAIDLSDRRPREQPALGPSDPLADRVVIGVEEIAVLRRDGLEIRPRGLEDERLEEPACVRQVPLDGAGIGHRLDDIVLDLQGRSRAIR